MSAERELMVRFHRDNITDFLDTLGRNAVEHAAQRHIGMPDTCVACVETRRLLDEQLAALVALAMQNSEQGGSDER